MMRFRVVLAVMTLVICQQRTSMAQSLVQPAGITTQAAQTSATEEASTTSIVIPAGTSVLMNLRSPLNTVSARDGSGLYLETTGDVIQQNRIVIPARTLVQGVIERGERPGRVKGRGKLQFHFTTLILPNNYTASIAGSLQSLPGSAVYEGVHREGAIQPVDQIDKDAAALVSSVAAGAMIGSIAHGDFRAGRGAMIGAAFGLGRVLFKRGDDIRLPTGTPVEMVLDRPVAIPLHQLAAYTQRSESPLMKQALPPALAAAPGEPASDGKRRHEEPLCPDSGLTRLFPILGFPVFGCLE